MYQKLHEAAKLLIAKENFHKGSYIDGKVTINIAAYDNLRIVIDELEGKLPKWNWDKPRTGVTVLPYDLVDSCDIKTERKGASMPTGVLCESKSCVWRNEHGQCGSLKTVELDISNEGNDSTNDRYLACETYKKKEEYM